MRPTLLLRVVLAACAAALAGLTPASARTPDRQTITHQGQERHYLLRLPPPPAVNAPLPLVIVLHGGGGHATNAEAMTGFTEKGHAEGFAVVYPEGTGRLRGRLLTWNAGHCCGWAMERGADDVGFIRTLIDHLVARHGIDATRVYVTGLSNGGMMAHRLGIELPDRIAAIAPVIATLFGDERPPARPVPMLAINGALDRSVPMDGGPPGGRFAEAWDGTPALPALSQGRFWARVNGCEATPDALRDGAVRRWRYRCAEGRAVEVAVIDDNGHAWPGGTPGSRRADPPSRAFDATDAIWAFFARHKR